MPTAHFEHWGRIEYGEAWARQKSRLEDVLAARESGEALNYLVFCEHPHVYTLGKHGDEHNMLLNRLQLMYNDASFHKVDRGGDITYHGPGQIVGYPIFDLYGWNIGIKEYIRRLEQGIIDTLAQYGIRGERLDGATGVWIDVGTPQTRKICAIGVKVSRHVTMHGFALNVNTDLNYFNFINPCGFVDKDVTSLAKELGRETKVEEVENRLKTVMTSIFKLQFEH
jgi:lipoyl(octanoyl) transferase